MAQNDSLAAAIADVKAAHAEQLTEISTQLTQQEESAARILELLAQQDTTDETAELVELATSIRDSSVRLRADNTTPAPA